MKAADVQLDKNQGWVRVAITMLMLIYPITALLNSSTVVLPCAIMERIMGDRFNARFIRWHRDLTNQMADTDHYLYHEQY